MLLGITVGVADPANAAPAPVATCTYSLNANGTYRLTWESVPGADYVFYRQIDGVANWNWRGRAGGTTWTDNGPTPVGDKNAEYRIATTPVGSWDPSEPTVCRRASPQNVSVANIVKTSGTSASNITISWNPVLGADSYRLYRIDGAGDRTQVGGDNTATQATDIGVTGVGGPYTWEVSAVTVMSAGAPRESWFSGGVEAPPPVDAGSISFSEDASGVVISWGDSPFANGYNLSRTDAGGSATYLGWVSANGPTSFVDTSTLTTGATYTWLVEPTVAGDLKGPKVGAAYAVTGGAATDETYGTALIGGRWEIIERDNPNVPARWEAVNVRGDRLASKPLDQADINRLAERFNVIRLNVHWSDVQPFAGADVSNYLDQEVLDVIRFADNADIGVVFDPMHLGGTITNPQPSADQFWIPNWAWQTAGITELIPQNSFEVLSHPSGGSNLGGVYLKQVFDWVKAHEAAGTFDNIVAFELVNEPHPEAGNAYANTDALVDLQAGWVQELRQIDADRPFVLTGYYGGSLSNAAQVRDSLVVNGDSRWDNLIWTYHTYYTGVPLAAHAAIDTDEDGFGDIDLVSQTWYRGSKRGTRAESDKGRGCYGQQGTINGVGEFSCPEISWSQRFETRQRLIAGIEAQDQVAQGANMPLFVGEVGVARYSRHSNGNWRGWGDSQRLMCDHLIAMRSLGHPGEDAVSNGGLDFDSVSFAAWNFDRRVDGFGIYDSDTNSWYDSSSGEAVADQQYNLTGQGTAAPFNTTFCTG